MGPFFFAEVMITGDIYSSILAIVAFLQLKVDEVEIFEQAGAFAQYSNIISDAPCEKFPHHWMERGVLVSEITGFDSP
jgi:hypothetical protein